MFHWDELLLLLLPTAIVIFGHHPFTLAGLSTVFWCWGNIVIPAEFFFALIFINRGHHGTEQVHQNDEFKSYDFGEYQLATTLNRKEANSNAFLSLTFYGDQVLHHLFPTLDSSILPQLRETLAKTCKEFDIKLPEETTMLRATFQQFKQLFRSVRY